LLDFGAAGVAASRRNGGGADDVRDHELEGATFASFYTAKSEWTLWQEEPIEHAVVALRVRGGNARTLGVDVDDRRVGVVKLTADESRVVVLPPLAAALERGPHVL